MLDFFLASVRKEPHLGLNQTFKSDRDAPDHSQESHYPPDHLQLYQLSFIRQGPCNNYFLPISSALWTLCKNHSIENPYFPIFWPLTMALSCPFSTIAFIRSATCPASQE